jgi:hypothetical protein
MPFALNANPSPTEISDAINYLLSNFSNGATIDPVTGQIIAQGGIIVGYLYKYIAVKYADSSDGSVNFSDSPTNRLYFGLRNSDDAAESNNYADYIWYLAAGGFGTTKFLWYQTTGGRQLQVAVSVGAPDVGWLQDTGSSIDLDIVTSGTIPVIVESFVSYFTPPVLQVPRTGNPLSPVFTYVTPALYATDKGQVIPFSDAQTDTGVTFTNNTWRIGNSSTTGYGDISKTNVTIGDPTDSGDFALWPIPTAMSNANAFITVPIRYKNSLGVISQASVATQQLVFVDPGATGLPGPTVDISGYASFTQNAGGLYNPTTATLSAITTNITSSTYSWVISGATPTSATTSSVVVTPTSSSTGVTVTLTVNGSNLTSTISKTVTLPVVYDGAAGTAGANGVMSAFPTIYIWTGSSVPPTRPSTTSTFTWSTGSYTAPAGWSSQAPSNTTAGNFLWSITIPLNVPATTTTSSLDWTNTSYPIRAIAYNGANGSNGSNGTNGANGTDGAATFVVTRTANDSSAPTNAECIAIIGRAPVAGDIVTVSYNNANNAVVYRYITSWTLFQTYITGSLIVQNTITGDKVAANTITATNINSNNLSIRDGSGNVIFSASQNLDYARIIADAGWLNNNISVTSGNISGIGTGNGTAVANNQITLSSNGTLNNAGGGSVTVAGLDNSILRSANPITSANISTYIGAGVIGNAYIGQYIQSVSYTPGVSGWQLDKNGSMELNSAFFRGDIDTNGDATFKGQNLSSQSLLIGGQTYFLDYSCYAEALTLPTLNTMRVGFYGRAASQPNVSGSRIGYNVGVVGYGQNYFGSKGVGVVGQGDQTGGYFSGTEYGVIADSNGILPISLVITDGTYFRWGLYNILTPTGTTTKFLRDDGQWAVPAGGGGSGTVTSVSGTGSVSGLSLSGTVTTSGSLTLGGSLSLTTGNLTATAPGSAYYLSGSGWTSTSPVMSLAGTNSGSATVSSNILNILGSTSTGIAGAYVGTSGSGNTVTLDVRTSSPSDLRLKEEIQEIDVGLAFVKQLRPVSYKLKTDPRHQKGYGFIAQEVENLIPNPSSLVYEEPDWKVGDEIGFKTIHYPSYIAVLTKAIQELTAKVEALEVKVK